MRKMRVALAAIPIALTLTLLGAAPAQAGRALLDETVLSSKSLPPTGPIEDACGLALTPSLIYVSDYYHGTVNAFSLSTDEYVSRIAPVGASPEGPCGLARAPGGALYANLWHRSVQRLSPSALTFDAGHESTGVAVDPTTARVYVDDRTYVAAYEPSGAPVEVSGQPLRIGAGNLQDAYGAAVYEGRLYVADAATGTVKAYATSGSPPTPVATISPDSGFVSLLDAALAVDPTNGHLVVADDTQPGYEHPLSALYEFDSSGTFVGKLSCNPVDGGPSGLAFDSSGDLYVTNGNGPGSNVFKYGPYVIGSAPPPSCAAVAAAGGHSGTAASASPSFEGGAAQPFDETGSSAPDKGHDGADGMATASEAVQKDGIRVALGGGFHPTRLPRKGTAGIRVSVSAKISAPTMEEVPQLRRIEIEINRAGHVDPTGLPACRLNQIQPASNAAARAACGRSLVGEGSFSADVRLPEQSPFPSQAKVLAFNGTYRGRPAIFAHVYGTQPLPTSYTLPFVIGKGKGKFGTALKASLPAVTGDAAAITGLSLTLGRGFSSHGHHGSYISAGCPAPAGFTRASFPLARATFGFPGHILSSTLPRTCAVR